MDHLPPGVETARDEDHTVVVLTWFSWMAVLRLVVGVAILLVLAQWAITVTEAPTVPEGLLGLVAIAAGLWITWLGLSRTLDKTTFAADDEALEVTTGPVPMHLPKRIPLRELTGFSLGRKVKRNPRTQGSLGAMMGSSPTHQDLMGGAFASGRWIVSWKVVALMRDGTEIVLARGLEERSSAVAVRRLLQEHLEGHSQALP